MRRFYFQYMTDNGNTASISAAVVEADDFAIACMKFIHEKHDLFYGPVGNPNTPDEALLMATTSHSIHGAREVPAFLLDGEVFKYYRDDDVRGFPCAAMDAPTAFDNIIDETSTGTLAAIVRFFRRIVRPLS